MDSGYRPVADRLTALAGNPGSDRPGMHTGTTTDRDTIRKWAALHKAEPATGEATASGPAVRHVNDAAPPIRFNFPGCGALRPITWEEWFDYFERHNLLFVYEEKDTSTIAERAYARWQARDSDAAGSDREDWLHAEAELHAPRDVGAAVGYRLVKNPQPR